MYNINYSGPGTVYTRDINSDAGVLYIDGNNNNGNTNRVINTNSGGNIAWIVGAGNISYLFDSLVLRNGAGLALWSSTIDPVCFPSLCTLVVLSFNDDCCRCN